MLPFSPRSWACLNVPVRRTCSLTARARVLACVCMCVSLNTDTHLVVVSVYKYVILIDSQDKGVVVGVSDASLERVEV